MANIIEGSNKNLYGGVSKQPEQVRLQNQVEAQTNALSSVLTGGFEKRPPTKYIARLDALDTTKFYKIHPMDRDTTTKDFLLIECGSAPQLFVYNGLTGAARTVTIGDTVHSHLVNAVIGTSTGIVELDGVDFEEQLAFDSGETQFDWAYELSDATTVFKVEGSADGVSWNDIATGKTGASGTFSTTIDAVATGDHNYIRVNITGAAGAAADTISIRATFKDLTYLLETDPEDLRVTSVADYTFICNTLVSVFKETEALNDVNSGSYPSTVTISGYYQTLSKLETAVPASGSGNIYKIIGNDSDGFGSFYVIDTDGGATDYYEEIVDPTISNLLAESSMPHQLVRSADGTTYTYSAASWDDRNAGNEIVNPDPDFVGNYLDDITFYRNRLVLISGESVFCTQSGDVFNVYSDKATEVLASDPIQRGATTNSINNLQYGLAFRKILFLTSLSNQFELDSGDREFSEENARLDQSTSYRTAALAKPATMSDVMYFCSNAEGSAIIYEYFYQESSFGNVGIDVSRHIRGYIDNDIIDIKADPAEQTVFILTTAAQHKLYVYRTFFEGEEKFQSSWSEYEFGVTENDTFIHGFAIFESEVYLIVERSDGYIYLESFTIEREDLDTGMNYMPAIDQRNTVAGEYDSTADVTRWITPWTHGQDAQVVIGGDATNNEGAWQNASYPDAYTIALASVTAGQTIVVGGKTFTAHATTTTTANREFSISGTNAADATELLTCINDATDGIGDAYVAYTTWNGQAANDGTVLVMPLDGVTIEAMTAPTGTAVSGGTATVSLVDIVIATANDYSSATTDYVGRDYTMTVELTKIWPTEAGPDGKPSAITTGRLQLLDITTTYVDTGYFKVQITPDGGRSATNYTFEGKVLGGGVLIDDGATIAAAGTFGHNKVLSRADTTKIEYINDTPLPCVITSIQWRGFFNENGRQG